MHKLPVMATAGEAYRFLLREFGTIVRLTWLPLLILAVIQYFAARAQFDALRESLASGGSLEASAGPFWQGLELIVALAGGAIVAVALHRVILFGDRKPGSYFHLAFGKVELLFAVVPVAIFVAMFVAFIALTPLLAVIPTFIFGVIAMIFIAAVVFVAVRLSVLFPVMVVEQRVDAAQAWRLSAGNFWQLLGVWLVVFIPAAVVVGIVMFGFFRPPWPEGDARDSIRAVVDYMESGLLVQTVLGFVWSIVLGALGVAVLSYSYKALNGRAPEDVITHH
jgi:hypothetical protein